MKTRRAPTLLERRPSNFVCALERPQASKPAVVRKSNPKAARNTSALAQGNGHRHASSPSRERGPAKRRHPGRPATRVARRARARGGWPPGPDATLGWELAQPASLAARSQRNRVFRALHAAQDQRRARRSARADHRGADHYDAEIAGESWCATQGTAARNRAQ